MTGNVTWWCCAGMILAVVRLALDSPVLRNTVAVESHSHTVSEIIGHTDFDLSDSAKNMA
jgi:hypothetical protein